MNYILLYFLCFVFLTSCVTPITIHNKSPDSFNKSEQAFSSPTNDSSDPSSTNDSSDAPFAIEQTQYLQNTSSMQKQKIWTKTVSTYLFGFISPAYIPAWKKCPVGKWKNIRISRSFSNILLAIFTLGIYTPVKVKIICQEQESSLLNETS